MSISSRIRIAVKYLKTFLKWLFCAGAVGLICGAVGVSFHYMVDIATKLRAARSWLLYLLPAAGLFIVFLYRVLKMEDDGGTNHIFQAIRTGERVPLRMAPLIYIGTVLTHLCGGSAGKEGAALQIGGSVSAFFGGLFHFNEKDMRIITLCGMSAVFSAIFGTPVTAALFCLEVISVGVIYYSALIPCLISALVARQLALYLGVAGLVLPSVALPAGLEFTSLLQTGALSMLCAGLGIMLCMGLHISGGLYKKLLPNSYIRVAAGGALVVLLSLVTGTRDYNGAGLGIIVSAVSGEALPWAFAAKLLFTALTLGAGYKGGEIVPTLFIGSAFGCFAGGLLGLDPGFGAALGLIGVFCGVVNCPISSIVLSVELFGGDGLVYFALACAVSYMLSGRFSLYSAQRIVYSKLEPTYVNAETR